MIIENPFLIINQFFFKWSTGVPLKQHAFARMRSDDPNEEFIFSDEYQSIDWVFMMFSLIL